jgi:acetyl esterase/lipase
MIAPRQHRAGASAKGTFLLAALLAASLCGAAGLPEEGIRISLADGKEGAAAPAEEPGKDKVHRIHKVPQPQLVVYPAPVKPSMGTVMVCPGGGYRILSVNTEGTDVAKMLNGCGWDAAVLLYRVGEGDGTRALAAGDAKAALSLLRERGGDFGLNTGRLGVMGFSAGGHLSARLAHDTAAAGCGPDFAVLMYPAYLEKEGECLDEVAPAKIPYFVYVADDDKHSASSRAFRAKCEAMGVACEAHFAEKGGHGFGLKNPLPEGVEDWPEKLRAFLGGLK